MSTQPETAAPDPDIEVARGARFFRDGDNPASPCPHGLGGPCAICACPHATLFFPCRLCGDEAQTAQERWVSERIGVSRNDVGRAALVIAVGRAAHQHTRAIEERNAQVTELDAAVEDAARRLASAHEMVLAYDRGEPDAIRHAARRAVDLMGNQAAA